MGPRIPPAGGDDLGGYGNRPIFVKDLLAEMYRLERLDAFATSARVGRVISLVIADCRVSSEKPNRGRQSAMFTGRRPPNTDAILAVHFGALIPDYG